MGTFSSDNSIEFERFERQKGLCAFCGKRMVRKNFERGGRGAWEAHHIDGDPDNDRLSNCACVHTECHLYFCHGGDYGGEYLIPKSALTLNR